MSDTPALFRCPFCGGDRQFEDFVSNTGGNIRFMRCQDCSAHGPWSTRSHSAQEKWNQRTPNAATQAEVLAERLRNIVAQIRHPDYSLMDLKLDVMAVADHMNAAPQAKYSMQPYGGDVPIRGEGPAAAAPLCRMEWVELPTCHCRDGECVFQRTLPASLSANLPK
jgi:Lar family restriction alleviation protein